MDEPMSLPHFSFSIFSQKHFTFWMEYYFYINVTQIPFDGVSDKK